MAYSLKENLMKEDRLSGGHRMCAGCGSPIAVRTVLRALNPEDKAVVCSATSCLEVSTFMYPYTAWKDSFIHNAFENAAATISGVETAYRAMKKRGKLDDTYKFIAFGGDGGTYDIGLQSLSGAMERGHDMVYPPAHSGLIAFEQLKQPHQHQRQSQPCPPLDPSYLVFHRFSSHIRTGPVVHSRPGPGTVSRHRSYRSVHRASSSNSCFPFSGSCRAWAGLVRIGRLERSFICRRTSCPRVLNPSTRR